MTAAIPTAAVQPTAEPAALPAQVAAAAEESQPRFAADLLPPASDSAVAHPSRSEQARISQLDFFKMVGEFRDNQDNILRVGSRSSGEEYYIQQACGPDPYIDRLVATVLALPRPQLEPPEPEPEPESELPEAKTEELLSPEPGPEQVRPDFRGERDRHALPALNYGCGPERDGHSKGTAAQAAQCGGNYTSNGGLLVFSG